MSQTNTRRNSEKLRKARLHPRCTFCNGRYFKLASHLVKFAGQGEHPGWREDVQKHLAEYPQIQILQSDTVDLTILPSIPEVIS